MLWNLTMAPRRSTENEGPFLLSYVSPPPRHELAFPDPAQPQLTGTQPVDPTTADRHGRIGTVYHRASFYRYADPYRVCDVTLTLRV